MLGFLNVSVPQLYVHPTCLWRVECYYSMSTTTRKPTFPVFGYVLESGDAKQRPEVLLRPNINPMLISEVRQNVLVKILLLIRVGTNV